MLDPWTGRDLTSEPVDWSRRRRFLGAHLQPGDVMVDVGCGNGSFLAFAETLGAIAIGVDQSARAVEYAREAVPQATVFQTDPGGSLPIEARSADVVWCSEVLEHVVEVTYLLTEIRRILKIGGKLVLTVPTYELFRRTLIAAFSFESHFDPRGEELRFFSRASVRTLLRESGFAIPEILLYGGVPLLRTGLLAVTRRD